MKLGRIARETESKLSHCEDSSKTSISCQHPTCKNDTTRHEYSETTSKFGVWMPLKVH